jgi:hypothetical protein
VRLCLEPSERGGHLLRIHLGEHVAGGLTTLKDVIAQALGVSGAQEKIRCNSA